MKDTSNNHYSIAQPGVVLTKENKLIWSGEVYTLQGDGFIVPDGFVKLNTLRALFSSDVSLPPKYWPLVRFEYHDGDETNDSPDNTVIIFPEGGIESEMKGFFYVPFYTSYVVNRDGVVINWRRDLTMSPYIAEIGYQMYGMTKDTGKRSIIGTHRVLAFAFLPYSRKVVKLDVNHKDGNKLNNEVENLEWSSRKHNCLHAYENDLRVENVKVLIKSIYTGEVIEFYSISECARQLNLNHTAILFRLQSDGQKVYYPGILMKRKDSETPWASETEETINIESVGIVSKIVLSKGDFEVSVSNYGQAARITGILPKSIRWRFKNWGREIELNEYKGKLESLKDECESAFAVMRKVNIL